MISYAVRCLFIDGGQIAYLSHYGLLYKNEINLLDHLFRFTNITLQKKLSTLKHSIYQIQYVFNFLPTTMPVYLKLK